MGIHQASIDSPTQGRWMRSFHILRCNTFEQTAKWLVKWNALSVMWRQFNVVFRFKQIHAMVIATWTPVFCLRTRLVQTGLFSALVVWTAANPALVANVSITHALMAPRSTNSPRSAAWLLTPATKTDTTSLSTSITEVKLFCSINNYPFLSFGIA